MRLRLILLLAAIGCGAKETYVPKAPDPADFLNNTGDTGDTATANRRSAPKEQR